MKSFFGRPGRETNSRLRGDFHLGCTMERLSRNNYGLVDDMQMSLGIGHYEFWVKLCSGGKIGYKNVVQNLWHEWLHLCYSFGHEPHSKNNGTKNAAFHMNYPAF